MNTNGVLSFDQRFNEFTPRPFPISTRRLISPYWENFETARFGHVYYRNTTEHALLWRAQFYLQDIFPSAQNYFPTYLIIATWDEIPQFGIDGDPDIVSSHNKTKLIDHLTNVNSPSACRQTHSKQC